MVPGSLDTTLVYRLERADWLAYESRSVPLSGSRFAVSLLFPMAAGGIYGIARESGLAWLPFASDGWVDKLALAVVVFLAWFVGMTAFQTLSAHRRAARHILASTDTTLTIADDGFTVAAGGVGRTVRWVDLATVRIDPRHIFLQPDIGPGIGEVTIVPDRAFDSHAGMVAFGQLADARRTADEEMPA